MPAWWYSLDRSRPVVLVTQGTLANRYMSQLIEPAIAALANEQMTVIVATSRPDLEAVVLPKTRQRFAFFVHLPKPSAVM